jgi:hypothetical protein
MRRRVISTGEDRYRVELPGGEISEFTCLDRKKHSPGREQYLLFWEDTFISDFTTKEDALMFVLRFGYTIADYHLVPSEVLADFGLVYCTGTWVDSWSSIGHREVRPVSSNVAHILRPVHRRICFTDFTPNCHATRNALKNSYFDKKGILNLGTSEERRSKRPEIRANIEIPKLDFEKLEKPKKRFRRISLNWRDRSQFAFGGYGRRKRDEPDLTPDEECVFTLKSGDCAENDPTA